MRMLNLCSGTMSVSRPFVDNGYEVVNVDWDSRYSPTHCVDIMTWNCPYSPGHFDIVWASPDCTQYSRARTTAKTERNLNKADALVKRCLDLIKYLNPRLWFVETQIVAYCRRTPLLMVCRLFVWIIVCMAHHIEKERAYGRMQTGRHNCAIGHI